MSHSLTRAFLLHGILAALVVLLSEGVPPVVSLADRLWPSAAGFFLSSCLGVYYRNLSDEKRCGPRNTTFARHARGGIPGGRRASDPLRCIALKEIACLWRGARRKLSHGVAGLFWREFILFAGGRFLVRSKSILLSKWVVWVGGGDLFLFGSARATLRPPGRAHLPN